MIGGVGGWQAVAHGEIWGGRHGEVGKIRRCNDEVRHVHATQRARMDRRPSILVPSADADVIACGLSQPPPRPHVDENPPALRGARRRGEEGVDHGRGCAWV